MRNLRQAGVLLATCSGLFALVLVGGALGPLGLSAMALIFVAPRLRPWLDRIPWAVVTTGVLLSAIAWVYTDGHPDIALGVALIYLQLHRVLSRTSPTDDRISLLLAGLMMVASASRIETGLWMLGLAGWTVGLVFGLLPNGGRSQSRSVQGLMVALLMAVMAVTTVLFPLIPRRAGAVADPGQGAVTGFTDVVELGKIGVLHNDSTVVFRVQTSSPVGELLYFRGVALEQFDGKRWWTDAPRVNAVQQVPDHFPDDAVTFSYVWNPDEDGTVFTAGEVLSVSSGTTGLSRDSHGAWRLVDAPDEVALTVVARGPWGRGSTAVTDPPRPGQYLDLPHRIDERVAELAVQISGTTTDVDAKIDRVSSYLRDNYDYTRAPRDVGEDEPLSTFLFDRRTGHCEYFASAQALLLRNLDVPARLVNGFVGGDLDPVDGQWVVRRHHAHSWVEAWNGQRWRVVDATPGAGAPIGPNLWAGLGERIQGLWTDQILGFDGARQAAALTSMGTSVQRVSGQTQARAVPWLGLATLCGLSFVIALVVERLLKASWRRLAGEAPKRVGPVARQHQKARAHLQSQGYYPPESLPPVEAAQWLVVQIGEPVQPLEELAWLMYRVRYGGENAVDLAAEAQRLAAAVMQFDAQRGTA